MDTNFSRVFADNDDPSKEFQFIKSFTPQKINERIITITAIEKYAVETSSFPWFTLLPAKACPNWFLSPEPRPNSKNDIHVEMLAIVSHVP